MARDIVGCWLMLTQEKMQKFLRNVVSSAVQGNTWEKFTKPTASRGNTAFPKTSAEQKNLGVRFDYDGEITVDDTVYHKFQMQPNAGDDIPSKIKNWRKNHGGTHSVMANVLVKKNGTKEDVEASLAEAMSQVEGV